MSIRITALTDPDHGTHSRRLVWLAADGEGNPVGTASLRLFTDPGQAHLAELAVRVHPAERRRGIGARLVDTAVEAAGADGRRAVVVAVGSGTSGEEFLSAQGFRKALTLLHSRLELAESGAVGTSGGTEHPYRLVTWDGAVPDELAAPYAAARRAMDDMPMGEVDHGTVSWDVDRLRAVARVVEERGEHLHTVAAVAASDGSMVGFTELVVPADGTGDGQHYGTAVLPSHRGHGLARRMKAEAIALARRRHPALGGLLTDTAEDNTAMRRVNEALGYRPTHETYRYQRVL
ncbi:GNAT family N-acetyltransferase [Kitasatospora purpeofusca]|uniref:GNAT family N-acetyltransferase n=1 Tax=Kitasatospora purpeofusca TaxID=67352 RepID=UPI00225884DE|nr:GNAT family N-acetyltransferase [Kitasatospora purpeofusca]MCX4684268.1 GNAT family N-acetyltransferase [Kitasatospora purpeofusca]